MLHLAFTLYLPRNTSHNYMIYIPFFIVILIDKRDDKKEQLTEGTDTSTVIGTSTGTKYKIQRQVQVIGTNTNTSTKIQVQVQVPNTKY